MRQTLQYLWIEKYKCIKNQEFNFTNRIRFHYDQEKQKIIAVENDYYGDFFGTDIELTCIVGQNGIGKTTLLRAIKRIFAKEYGGVDLNCIAIFFDKEDKSYKGWYILANGNNENHCITTDYEKLELFNQENKIQYNGKKLIDNYKSNIVKNCEHFDNAKARYIYLSEQLVQSQYTQPMEKDELATSFLLYYEFLGKSGDNVNRYFLKEFENQINLIIEYGQLVENFNIRYTPVVKAVLLNDIKIWHKYVQEYEVDVKKFDQYYSKFLPQHNTSRGVSYFKDKLAESMFLSMINMILHTVFDSITYDFHLFIKLMKECSTGSAWNNFRQLVFKVGQNSMLKIPLLDRYMDFADYIDYKCIFSESKNVFASLKFGQDFYIPTENNIDIETDLKTNIKEFFQHYKQAADFYSFISFSWDLSSGETCLLNIFSRLNSLLKIRYSQDEKKEYYLPDNDVSVSLDANGQEYTKEEENVVLLLDEVEVSLHPEWQRNMINELLKFIKLAFTGSNIHVIMTTHSPIMLSDIPKQNVLYLSYDDFDDKKTIYENQPETFGSNIFKLYNNAFFLDKGAIGAFAKSKLEDLLEEILKGNGEKEDLQKRINLIGDDFLRERFQSKFDAIYNNTQSVDDEIVRLEEKINQLKKIRDMVNECDQKKERLEKRIYQKVSLNDKNTMV
ncbi:AAA family ATPase [Ruminococcus sp. HUN007]|uniref:AAA family ATPase n=1 Tax=Ruminococcus sp. HUN007 TaxID=1514668 RepID=UPI0005D2CC3E|nr:AAA family ATPase [Ruminococcus sp. HUN007]